MSFYPEGPDENPPCCPSCGTPWQDHDGMTLTCKALQDARAEIEALRHDRQPDSGSLMGAYLQQQKNINEARAMLEQRDARIAELEAIVARLPKTADGVSVTPGMWLWSLDSEGQPYSHGFGVVSHSDASWGEIYYSTEAAALAAKQTTDTKE